MTRFWAIIVIEHELMHLPTLPHLCYWQAMYNAISTILVWTWIFSSTLWLAYLVQLFTGSCKAAMTFKFRCIYFRPTPTACIADFITFRLLGGTVLTSKSWRDRKASECCRAYFCTSVSSAHHFQVGGNAPTHLHSCNQCLTKATVNMNHAKAFKLCASNTFCSKIIFVDSHVLKNL